MRTRAAGLLMLGLGLKARAIASQLGVSGQSVYNWLHAWRERASKDWLPACACS
nr:helix-turn-helix domain-containing protein [Paraburkholderia guartelaensis]